MTADTERENEPRHEGYITKSEVARRLKRVERTIENYMHRGWLPYYRVGRTIYFKWSEVEACFGEKCRVHPRLGSE